MGGSHKVPQPIVFPETNPGDFPLVLSASDSRGVLFMLTKEGFFHMYDGLSGKRLMANKVSAEHFFIGGPFEANGGVYGINKTGSVRSLSFLSKSSRSFGVSLSSPPNSAFFLFSSAYFFSLGVVSQREC
jgi:clathrin heavy chain